MSHMFLVKHHSLINPFPLRIISRVTMPLFQLSVYDLRPFLTSEQKRCKLFKQPKIYYSSKQQKSFDRLLCISANIGGNCRRGKLINTKRNSLLEYFNDNKVKQLTKGKCFNITLGKANYIVSDNQLITQLRLALAHTSKNIINQSPQKQLHKQSNSVLLSIHNLLSHLSISLWTRFLSNHFSRSPNTLRYLQLQNSYINVSLMNYYQIKESKNSQMMYQDMKDFDSLLTKFNFIRFFMTNGADNICRAQKNCELLIKNIKWRTQQTQQYLLILLRNNSWERVCLTVQNFCVIFQNKNKY